MKRDRDRFEGCLLGLACGDAVGTTLEFQQRGSFKPIGDMIGGGPFALQAGQWTDDTSMALCLATSLLERDGFDAEDQMKRYVRWRDEGYLSSTGRCFDIGNTIAGSLRRFEQTGDPFAGSRDPYSAGNGSIMRLAPVPMFYFGDEEEAVRWSGESSRTTHQADEAVDACRLFGRMLHRALAGGTKEEILTAGASLEEPLSPQIQAIAQGAYRERPVEEIHGTGYVVRALEAALWCFEHGQSFEESVLMAANLGHDADTTAAICGQVAGAHHGKGDLPDRWLQKLAHRDLIEGLAEKLGARR